MTLDLLPEGMPLQAALIALLRRRIFSGALGAGARLPSTRALAAELGVSRNTVLAAYDSLRAEGYLIARPGSGHRVAGDLPEPADLGAGLGGAPAGVGTAVALSQWGRRVTPEDPQPAVAASPRYDFLYGTSNTTLFPHKDWRRAILGVLDLRRREPGQLFYQDAMGSPALRRAVADWLRLHRGIDTGTRGVVITNGSQQGIDLATRLLVDPGAVVAVEEPGYQGFREILSALGARLLPIPVDDQGLRVDHLEAVSRDAAVAGVCVTPSHQFPTGAVLSPARRMALLAWAKAEGAWVIEDDYDSEFRYGARPLAALAAGDDDGRVIHLASFSKALFPALRLGMASVPAGLLGPFGAARRLSDRHGPALEQDALARWMEDGTFARHLRRVRTRQAERRAVLVDALTRHFVGMVRIGGASAGLHLVAWFPGLDAAAMAAWADRAAVLGIGVHPITRHYQGPAAAAFVLGYAGISVDDIPAGIGLLKACAPL